MHHNDLIIVLVQSGFQFELSLVHNTCLVQYMMYAVVLFNSCPLVFSIKLADSPVVSFSHFLYDANIYTNTNTYTCKYKFKYMFKYMMHAVLLFDSRPLVFSIRCDVLAPLPQIISSSSFGSHHHHLV